jgi:hypothetical protein
MKNLTDLEKLRLIKDILGRVECVRLDVGLKLEVAGSFVDEAIEFMDDDHRPDCPAVDGFGCHCGEVENA